MYKYFLSSHLFLIYICNSFFSKQGKSSYFFFSCEKSKIDSKCSISKIEKIIIK